MTIRHLLSAFLLIVSGAVSATEAYRVDPTAYFASPLAEASQRKTLQAEVAALPTPAAPAPKQLLDYLHTAESLLGRMQRHTAYLHLRTALDIDDHDAADALSSAQTTSGEIATRVRTTLRKLGKPGFDHAVASEPALGKYNYLFDRAVRGLSHELAPGEQAILDDLSDQGSTALWNVYQKTRRATDYGKLHTAEGDLDIDKDADKLAADADRNVRREAWQRRQAAPAANAETYASLLIGVVRLTDRAAKLQHFADAPEAAYFSRQLTRADVDATAKAVEANAAVLMDYQRLRAAHSGHLAGVTDVHRWDMGLTPKGFAAPRFDYDRIRQVVPAALAPLGKDYVRHFTALLDPAEHRTDLATTQGSRVDDAFSIAALGVPAGLFLGQWKSTLRGASVVAHEGGHAIQSQLINENHVSPFYGKGPSWMDEGIAILNEMLFNQYLYEHAPDPQTKAYYLAAQLDEMTFEIFTSAEEAQLEEGIYDGVIAGNIRGAADLDALTLATTRRFEIWPDIDPELRHAWIGKRLMYQDPLYLANYLYAGLLATKMMAMATQDPADFQKRYTALMSEGFDAPPKDILRRFFGHDLSPQELVDADMALIRGKTMELRRLYTILDK